MPLLRGMATGGKLSTMIAHVRAKVQARLGRGGATPATGQSMIGGGALRNRLMAMRNKRLPATPAAQSRMYGQQGVIEVGGQAAPTPFGIRDNGAVHASASPFGFRKI